MEGDHDQQLIQDLRNFADRAVFAITRYGDGKPHPNITRELNTLLDTSDDIISQVKIRLQQIDEQSQRLSQTAPINNRSSQIINNRPSQIINNTLSQTLINRPSQTLINRSSQIINPLQPLPNIKSIQSRPNVSNTIRYGKLIRPDEFGIYDYTNGVQWPDKDIWVNKLKLVQNSNYVRKIPIDFSITVPGMPRYQYVSNDARVRWNEDLADQVSQGYVIPPESVFYFVEDVYDDLSRRF